MGSNDDAESTQTHGSQESAVPAPTPARRLAAASALVTLTAAVVIVVASLLRDPIRLTAVVITLLIAVAAGWTALCRRGAGRIPAAAAMAAGVVVFVLLLTAGSLLRLAVVVALTVAAVLAARVALGTDLADEPGKARRVGPARRGVLLMNPRSGGGKVERFQLEEKCHQLGITPVLLKPGDDLRALAESALSDGADVIGMAGGDGSQALVADVARRVDVPFVVVPAGTRNHFALDLGLDRENVAAALAAFSNAVERTIDLALLGDRVFVNNVSLGVYAAVVQSEEYRDAKVGTAAHMAPDLLGSDAPQPDLRYAGPDGQPAMPATVLLVSNGPYRLDRLTGFGTRPRLDSGVLGVVAVTVDRARDVPILLAAEAAGQVHRFHGYQEWTTPEFEVDSREPLVDVGVDGEALRLPPPLRFRCLAGALRVRIPLEAGPAPAAAAPAGPAEAVVGLARVLAGHAAR
ncbi:MAG: NAD(+)/NADH kinase [Pseudonocardia sp.]|nr:NAD(+)/NADH kinase [Pseudonocardia sp.]